MLFRRKTAIYFAPHQDDELLTMGIDICNTIQEGYEVHVVLCTDGAKSKVRWRLNNREACPLHEELHFFPIYEPEFIKLRDIEFTESCIALGVKEENVHIAENRGVDGTLEVERCEDIIKHYVETIDSKALVCTIFPGSIPKQHADHKALGTAADNLLTQGVLHKVKFLLETHNYDHSIEQSRSIPVYPTYVKASDSVVEKLKNAIAAYSKWDPDNKRYAIGAHSMSQRFQAFLESCETYYLVKYNNETMTRKERQDWEYHKWLKLQKTLQLYYSLSSCEQPDLKDLHLVTVDAGETAAYREFCYAHGIAHTAKNKQRIEDGSSFWCLVSENNEIITSGWLAYKQSFYIGETDYGFEMKDSNTGLLFDFNTKPEHRGNGYYGLLLKAIVHNAKGPENFIIYTGPNNTSSSNGILKAGFTYDGTLSAADNTLEPYLKKQGFTSITRKYPGKGFRV